MRWMRAWTALLWTVAAMAGDGPYLLVLGTAQDGGLPQIGCRRACCVAVRENPAKRRTVASLLLVDRRDNRRWLIDAAPQLPEQLALWAPPPRPSTGPGRPKLVDGVFLTHAHTGHYLGLAHLGREAYNHPKIPLYGSERMQRFLKENGPWSLLIDNGNIKPTRIAPGRPVALAPGLRVKPFLVPHRDEFTDTFGFVIEGPERKALYIPDIDKWERWERRVEDMIARVDVALLDGTFFADGEIPGRAMADIPHPFIEESLARFKDLPKSERSKIWFIHLNHSNPAADPSSEAAARIVAAGMEIANEGQSFDL